MAKEATIQTLQPGFQLKSKERTYEIVKVLGAGSFGITYLATAQVSIGNISTTVRFAIKEHFMSASCYRGDDGVTVNTVPSAKKDVAGSRADFMTEANRLKGLCQNSRNIVSVNETFEANGTAYYVMEYLDGGNPSRCTEKEAISIVLQIANALEEIHREHVLHLDLKPENIVLKTNDKNETYPVLIDFGLSKHFDSKGRPTSSINAKGASVGYAPQEQYAGVTEFSPKYDIYALGAVLFNLCTGKNPPDAFKVSPNQQELKKELGGDVSPNVEKAILNAMKPSSLERTSTIKQFYDDLRGVDFIPVLNVKDSQIQFQNGKGKQIVSVESNIDWTAYAESDWCNVSKSGDCVVITVSKNHESGSRTCNVVVKGNAYQIYCLIEVSQKGSGTLVFSSGSTWWERNSRTVYAAGGCILVICCLWGMSLFFRTNSEKESRELTEAIANSDVLALKKFADLDSVRAYEDLVYLLVKQSDFDQAKSYADRFAVLDPEGSLLPTARMYMKQGNYTVAKNYVEKYLEIYPDDESIGLLKKDLENLIQKESPVQENLMASAGEVSQQKVDTEPVANEPKKEQIVETNDQKFARAGNDFNLMLSLARDKYAKAYYPLALMYYNRKDTENARRWAEKAVNANVDVKSARNLLARIKPAESSDEKLFAKARTIQDYLPLAKKGYKKAYAPLAELYLKKHDYDNAHLWAVRACGAGVGVNQARKVVDILDSYGYYDNGEHGGKPKC